MHAGVVTLLSAAVVAAAAWGLVVTEERAGPVEATLRPVVVDVRAEGSHEARAGTAVGGLCPVPPCTPRTTVDLRFFGLPDAPYTARLEGATTVEVGPLTREGDALVLRWSEPEDHTDKQHLVLELAGRDIATLPLRDGPVDAALKASWDARPATARLNEIGGVTVSTVVSARLEEPAPAGWSYHAHLEGRDRIDLGRFDPSDGGAVLDGRVERVGIEDQDRLVVSLVSAARPDQVFPVLEARL